MRVFATSPDSEWTRSIESSLRSPQIRELVTSNDPRTVRTMLDQGPIDVVLLHERFATPAPPVIAQAFHKLVGHRRASIVLVTDNVTEHDPTSPFDATIKWPITPRIFVDRIRRLAAARNTPRVPDDARILHADVEVRCLHLDAQNHYEVLGVGPTSAADVITQAYDRLSLTFHPDRVRSFGDAELTEKASALFARIVDAYRVLRNPGDRARYDRTLRAGGDTERSLPRSRGAASLTLEEYSDNPAVQKVLRTAQRAIAGKDLAMALTQLRFAHSLEPTNELIEQRITTLERLTGTDP